MSFIYTKDKDGFFTYKCSEKINSKKATIEFSEDFSYGKYIYSIYLYVSRKRKFNTFLKSTGGGLTYLLWAKNKIIEFEKYILDIRGNHALKLTMSIEWDDNRRQRVYVYGLKKLGYRIGVVFNKKCLIKNLLHT
jgi:hypothetical protein